MHKRWWWWWWYYNERKIARRVSKVFSLSLSICLSFSWTLILWHFLVVPLDFPSALPVRILPPAPSDDAKREPDERLFRHVHVLRHAVVHRLTHSSSSLSSSSSLGTQKCVCVCVCVSTQNFCKREKTCADDGPTTTTTKKKKKKKRVLNPNRPPLLEMRVFLIAKQQEQEEEKREEKREFFFCWWWWCFCCVRLLRFKKKNF
jgi:hypothetical protein